MNSRYIAGLILFFLSSTLAAAPLVLNPGGGAIKNKQTGTVGLVFKVGPRDITVTHLGFWDDARDGNNADHSVGIWGDAVVSLLASATVKKGAASQLLGEFRYEPITPIILSAGATYRLGAQVVALDGDSQHDAGIVFNIKYSPGVIPVSGAYSDIGTGFVFPKNSYGAPGVAHIGPNMQFSIVAEPPPASLSAPGNLRLAR